MRGGKKGVSAFRLAHRSRQRLRTEGNPQTWSGCQCVKIMSDMSGRDGFRGFSSAARKIGGYSGFPSPVSTRMYGLEVPTMYVLVPDGTN
jgi:hypothetical protein